MEDAHACLMSSYLAPPPSPVFLHKHAVPASQRGEKAKRQARSCNVSNGVRELVLNKKQQKKVWASSNSRKINSMKAGQITKELELDL